MKPVSAVLHSAVIIREPGKAESPGSGLVVEGGPGPAASAAWQSATTPAKSLAYIPSDDWQSAKYGSSTRAHAASQEVGRPEEQSSVLSLQHSVFTAVVRA
jgi:hypothetical protein